MLRPLPLSASRTALLKKTKLGATYVDGSENLVHLDIGYRLMVIIPKPLHVKTGWHGHYGSYGGERGVWMDVRSAKAYAKSKGIKKGTYEVWKFHIGLSDSEVPWFPPTKVYPE